MFKRVRRPGDYMLFVVVILLISFLVNVYISINNYKFKYRIGRESYTNIEKIKSTNKTNNEILNNAIKVGCLDNMELLKLYKNYGELSDSMVSLWDEYSFYEENKTQSYKVELTGKTLENFNSILIISNNIDSYYNEFYDKNLSSVDIEDREKAIIKKYYWIEILEDINEINQKYINSDFTF